MRWLLLSVLLSGCAAHRLQGAPAVADIVLPRDHGAHDAQTEWWHFHGHVTDSRGNVHDFFVGFVRWHTDDDKVLFVPMRFFVDPGQVAIFTYTDRAERTYRSREKVAYPDVWAASAAVGKLDLFHDDWSARGDPTGMHLVASAQGVDLELTLTADKPVVLEGDQGRFGSPPHLFYTLPRLQAAGTITRDGERLAVTGLAWVKHQWGTLYSDAVAGWVWFGAQLDDGTDLQIGLIRDRLWRDMPGSFAELIHADGAVERLELRQVGVVQTGEVWTSPRTGVAWPVGWRIELPRGRGSLELVPAVPEQELFAFPMPMWAGSLAVRGTLDGRRVTGDALAEIFGLAQSPLRDLYRPGVPGAVGGQP